MMSEATELADDKAEWVEINLEMLGFTRSPGSGPGAEMHSPANLTILYSALQERLTGTDFHSFASNDEETKNQGSPGFPAETNFGLDCLTVLPTGVHPNKEAHTSELYFSQFGEWPSRPDVSDLPPLIMGNPSSIAQFNSSPQLIMSSDSQELLPTRPWRLRHSPILRWRIVDWMLRNLPYVLNHLASFLFGAATMCLLLKKRTKLPFVGCLPLE